ncbi:MAG TPA: SUF system Fe-S cluster assembly regulator [Magnetospirillaceae bacterium]|nr:SUF system Fe-S cluster assembly regulator [Magnetospirillaceae bacterium]
MRLARMTDYAVVVLCQMARATTRDVFNASALAEATGLPLPSVSKILKKLAQKDVLIAHRGAAGGYSLARSPREITAREIIVALEGPLVLAACVEEAEENCGFERSCPIRGHWDPVNGAIHDALGKVTLAEMAQPRAVKLPSWALTPEQIGMS